MSNKAGFMIVRKDDKDHVFTAGSGKRLWSKPGHAKAAFRHTVRNSNRTTYGLPAAEYEYLNRWRSVGFDEQDVWEIIELKDLNVDKLAEATELLECIFVNEPISFDMEERIAKFLGKEVE